MHQAPPQGCSLLRGAKYSRWAWEQEHPKVKFGDGWRRQHMPKTTDLSWNTVYPSQISMDIWVFCSNASCSYQRGELFCVLGPSLDPAQGKKTSVSFLLWRHLQGSLPHPKAEQWGRTEKATEKHVVVLLDLDFATVTEGRMSSLRFFFS